MGRSEYYSALKALALQKRAFHKIETARFGLREARQIYKAEGIRIDHWPLPSKIKALYMAADGESSVALQKSLPDEPKLFALMHEYRHHLTDRVALGNGVIHCGDHNANKEIEIGAEVFAAEFIYPEDEFRQDLQPIECWRAEDIVRFKRQCKAKVSYMFIRKRLERLGLIATGQFADVRFQKLEENMFGVPFYKRRWASKRG